MPWYATRQIWQGTALAYDVGHPVPASNVERHGYDVDGAVVWAESAADIPAAADASSLMGAFANAPQPEAAEVEVGGQPPAEPGDAADAVPAPAGRRVRRGPADTTSTETATEA